MNTQLFRGLSAFPLTPLSQGQLDVPSFEGIIRHLVHSEVDSITVLGSTGCYPYFESAQRAVIAQRAVECADGVPVFVGVGAVSTDEVLRCVDSAQAAGAQGLLLAPVSYHPLTEEEVFGLCETVVAHSEVPIILYDNPGTTHFTFSLDLYAAIARLPRVASIKIPGVHCQVEDAARQVQEIRRVIPRDVTVGISRDVCAPAALAAGVDAWYSVLAGTLPAQAREVMRAAQSGSEQEYAQAVGRLTPLWELCDECGGSVRVMAAVAHTLGLAQPDCLPRPLRGLGAADRLRVHQVVEDLVGM